MMLIKCKYAALRLAGAFGPLVDTVHESLNLTQTTEKRTVNAGKIHISVSLKSVFREIQSCYTQI